MLQTSKIEPCAAVVMLLVTAKLRKICRAAWGTAALFLLYLLLGGIKRIAITSKEVTEIVWFKLCLWLQKQNCMTLHYKKKIFLDACGCLRWEVAILAPFVPCKARILQSCLSCSERKNYWQHLNQMSVFHCWFSSEPIERWKPCP